jgi:hypothetical protein
MRREGRVSKHYARRGYVIELTIAEYLAYMLPRMAVPESSYMPSWPPDVFAIATSLLQRTGAYATAIDNWPPSGKVSTWETEVRGNGKIWRSDWKDRPFAPLQACWDVLLAHASRPLADVNKHRGLLDALMELCATADETCEHVGVVEDDDPRSDEEIEAELEFDFKADDLLVENSLCSEIHTSRLRVLPKRHTPQSGLTIRSFSLHLSLITTDEIRPIWNTIPSSFLREEITICLIPWPLTVNANDFVQAPSLKHELKNMPDKFDFFAYTPQTPANPVAHVNDVVTRARIRHPQINAVVLPEMALSPTQFNELETSVVERLGCVLISGTGTAQTESARCQNEVYFSVPNYGSLKQAKHHRWKLNRSQIEQYELSELDPTKDWWEHIDISSRKFMFNSLGKGRVISVLICEDLARPDPVGDLIRAVAPNLIIALLMDGPQLKGRWPGHYASSLASDPGSSVLSVTSIGMTLRSKPRDPATPRSRVIGLWHSTGEDPVEMTFQDGDEALIITLQGTYGEEWTADGRHDARTGGKIRLKGWKAFSGT